MHLRFPRVFGYTFIEVIAVIFIMVTVGTALLVNFWSSRDRRQTSESVLEVTSSLREVQAYALGAVSFAGDSTGVTTKSYGAYFTWQGSTYTLFADKDGDGVYTVGTDYTIETRPTEVQNWLFLSANCPASTPVMELNVTFTPPHPIVRVVRDGGTTCSMGCVNLVQPDGLYFTRVSVAPTGVIDTRVALSSEPQPTCP